MRGFPGRVRKRPAISGLSGREQGFLRRGKAPRQASLERDVLTGIQEGELTLGSDNGSALTARRFKARLTEQGIRHRRGGYRDPESQGLHRKLARETEKTQAVAERTRNPRLGPPWYRRLPRALPPPPPPGAQLPGAPRGAPDMGRPTTTTKTSGLTPQHQQGTRHLLVGSDGHLRRLNHALELELTRLC